MIHILAPHLQQLHTLRLINTSAAHAGLFAGPDGSCEWVGQPDDPGVAIQTVSPGAFEPVPQALSTLPALTSLQGIGWTLVLTSMEWDTLASCSKLQRLERVLVIDTAPHNSLKLLQLTYLHARYIFRADVAAVLAGAPALRELVLEDEARGHLVGVTS
jgi:hypothetical protein